MVSGDRNNDDNGGSLYEPSDNDVYRGGDASVYNVFCASDDDGHATFCNAGLHSHAGYDADCANHNDHHIPFCNDHEHDRGIYDVSDLRHEQKKHQH